MVKEKGGSLTTKERQVQVKKPHLMCVVRLAPRYMRVCAAFI